MDRNSFANRRQSTSDNDIMSKLTEFLLRPFKKPDNIDRAVVVDETELAQLYEKKREDVFNRRLFNEDIRNILEMKRKMENKVNESHRLPVKTTYQEKNPKHETLKKLMDIAGGEGPSWPGDKPMNGVRKHSSHYQGSKYKLNSCPLSNGHFSIHGMK